MPSNRGIVVAPMSVGDILQNTTSVTVGSNVLGQILFSTPTVEKLFGYTSAELMGKNITMLMPERFKSSHLLGYKQWVDTGELSFAGKELKASGLHKDGHEFPISITIGSYYDGPDLRAVATIKDVKDIIELEEATELMRRELNASKSITENIGTGIIATDIHGMILSVNPMAERLTGFMEEELVGREMHETLHQFDPDGSIESKEDCAIIKTLENGAVRLILDDYFRRKDRTFLNIDATVAPTYRDKTKTGLVISFLDISDRKARDAALKESEERYRNLVELSPDPICVYANGKFIYANKAALKMVGAESIDQVVGKPVLDFIHPDYHKLVVDRMTEVMSSGKALPLLHEKALRIDGSPIDIEVASMPIIFNHSKAAITVIRDISDRIMEERRYEIITEGVLDMIAMTAMDGKIMFANHPAHYLALGYAKGELEGVMLKSLIHPDDSTPLEQEAKVLAHLQSGERLPVTRARMRHKNGHYVWVEGSGALITQGNNLVYFLSTVRDISEVIDREKRIQQFVDNIPQLVWTADVEGNIYWYNNNWYEYTGQDEESAKNWGWEKIHHPDHLERVKAKWVESIETGKPFELQFPLRRHDGVYRWFLTRVNPVIQDGVVVRWVGSNTDVEDNRRAYELRSRLAAIIESSQAAIIGKTLHGTVTEWNPGAERLYGYAAIEMIGKNISTIVPPDKLDELETIMRHLRTGEKVVDLITDRVKKNGERIKINIISSPISDIDGIIIGASTVATPITPIVDTDTPLESRMIVADIAKERDIEATVRTD